MGEFNIAHAPSSFKTFFFVGKKVYISLKMRFFFCLESLPQGLCPLEGIMRSHV